MILYDAGVVWDDSSSLRFIGLQSALVNRQLENYKNGRNGGGGTPVSLRPCLGPEDAAEVLESEVERRKGQVGGQKYTYFQAHRGFA